MALRFHHSDSMDLLSIPLGFEHLILATALNFTDLDIWTPSVPLDVPKAPNASGPPGGSPGWRTIYRENSQVSAIPRMSISAHFPNPFSVYSSSKMVLGTPLVHSALGKNGFHIPRGFCANSSPFSDKSTTQNYFSDTAGPINFTPPHNGTFKPCFVSAEIPRNPHNLTASHSNPISVQFPSKLYPEFSSWNPGSHALQEKSELWPSKIPD